MTVSCKKCAVGASKEERSKKKEVKGDRAFRSGARLVPFAAGTQQSEVVNGLTKTLNLTSPQALMPDDKFQIIRQLTIPPE
jgi:hypothetical protein